MTRACNLAGTRGDARLSRCADVRPEAGTYVDANGVQHAPFVYQRLSSEMVQVRGVVRAGVGGWRFPVRWVTNPTDWLPKQGSTRSQDFGTH